MAVFNLDFYNQIDSYSDGDIEDILLAYARGEITWEQLMLAGNPYAALYHFSPLRENILNWYPFEKGATVLEIGSGCGAITGILCEKAGKVVSVELSRRRATINYARHKDLNNLTIMVGNLNDMTFPEKFDYVVLNGVLEYAMSFTEGDHPYETFISGIQKFLKDDGHMLIAIENRLGLKYFNGAPEDHTNHYFEGINGYPENNTVRTFSKKEMEELLNTCGLTAQRFYYPYPDYKFPAEIFTDETILKFGYGKSFINLDEKRYLLFDEKPLWNTLTKEEVTASFANSFLVDASKNPWQADVEKLYVKINNDRRDDFRIGTSVELQKGEKRVVKYPLCKEAASHIRALIKNGNSTPSAMFQNLKGSLVDGGGIGYPYLEGTSLDNEMKTLIQNKQSADIFALLHQVFDIYGKDAKECGDYETPAFRKVFGDAVMDKPLLCVKPANIDLICDNIFPAKKGYDIIDCEWVFDMPIPLTFVIWRCINELYTKYPALNDLIERKAFMEEFSIDEYMSQVFWHWATYFAKEYVGSATIESSIQPMETISIDNILQKKRLENMLCSSLYVDLGEGFSEETKLYSEVALKKNHFSITYNLDKLMVNLQQVRALRFDPLEGDACVCAIHNITGVQAKDGETEVSRAVNASDYCQEGNVFLTIDPIYYLEGEVVSPVITIEGTIRKLSSCEQLSKMEENTRELRQEHNRIVQEKATLEEEYAKLQQAYEQVVKDIEEIQSSRAWKMLNKLKGN